jgi:uncharacterized protein YigE (DUF2233 family)
LINGKITPHFIPEYTLRKTIDGIVGILQKDYSQFHLIQNKPSMFYQNAKFFFTRRSSKAKIQVEAFIFRKGYEMSQVI